MKSIWNLLPRIMFLTLLNFIAYAIAQGFQFPAPSPQTATFPMPKFAIYYAAEIFNHKLQWDFAVISQVSQRLVALWDGIDNPVIKCLVFWGGLLILLNLYWAWRDWVLLNKLSLKCTACNLLAAPIAGTKNRYRCLNGHQFFGDPHDRF